MARARVSPPTPRPGGILGDAPGYGKTATTIGLVDAGVEGPPEIPSDQQPYFFHSKASLVAWMETITQSGEDLKRKNLKEDWYHAESNI